MTSSPDFWLEEHSLYLQNEADKNRLRENLNKFPGIIQSIFEPSGILQTEFGKKHRKSQYDMAMDYTRSLLEGRAQISEAGTGTGKTLAYGIPIAIFSVLHPKILKVREGGIIKKPHPEEILKLEEKDKGYYPFQFAISVHTLSLQDQLEGDLQIVKEITKRATGIEPSYKRISGRNNYFCDVTARYLLENATDHETIEAAKALLNEFEKKEHINGFLSELPSSKEISPEVLKEFAASEDNCASHKKKENCNYLEQRREIPNENIIIINHNLLVLRYPGTWDSKVIDEAHTLEDVVIDALSEETSYDAIVRALKRTDNANPTQSDKIVDTALAQEFLQTTKRVQKLVTEKKVSRVLGPFPEDLQTKTKRFQTHLELSGKELALKYHGSKEDAEEVTSYIKGGEAPSYSGINENVLPGVRKAVRSLKELYQHAETLRLWMEGPPKQEENKPRYTKVHWSEMPPASPGENANPTFKISESEPRLYLRAIHRSEPSLLTSATLSGPDGLEGFAHSQGLDDSHPSSQEYPPPFNLDKQMRVVIPPNLPTPGSHERDWKAQLPKHVENAIQATKEHLGGGGTLVLLTSRTDLNLVKKHLEDILEEEGQTLLIQEPKSSKKELINQMREDGNAVLLGLDSFWTGVDIQGDALKHVVISRLPFQVPTPLTQARKEKVKEEGGNPFKEVDLAAAVTKFKQGVGRLIRTTTDSGAITILDPRIVSKPYGRDFLHGLPKPTRSYFNTKEAAPIKLRENYPPRSRTFQDSSILQPCQERD